MTALNNSFFPALVLSLLLSAVFATNVYAHDDGLTCHQHPLPYQLTRIFVTSYGRVDIGHLTHQIDNSIGEQPQVYAPEDVRKLRRAFTEIREAIELVSSLVARADRSGPEDNKQILSLSHVLYRSLRLNQFVSYDAIVDGVRTRSPIALDTQNLKNYLSVELGVSDTLIILLEQAAQSCG